MSLPLVSVLIPNFNSNFLVETLQSVLDQTYENLEIIIVDDGSTNNSLSDINYLKSKKIKVFSQTNKGACAARNYAFSVCTGDYIQYLDADDILSLNKIEIQVEMLKKSSRDAIASCSWVKFKDSPKNTEFQNFEINKDYSDPVNWLIDSWSGKGVGQTSIWLTPRHIIEKAGEWTEGLSINQDGEFFSRVLINASQIKYCESANVYYRSGNPESVSQSNNKNKLKAEALLSSYMLYEKNIPEYLKNEEVKKALANNYISFIYHFHPQYPELLSLAKNKFHALGFSKMWPQGGKTFKKIANGIGFEKALTLRDKIKFLN
ncbi:glycosyltransferase family 2 protein [Christiangramia sp. ASW11-125]|uniref:glycosyltransferase family 2 protein n=1 Tax=Christiangramia sp. ASW11-125 TaxID=3400701 RepID=UPI003AAB1FFA